VAGVVEEVAETGTVAAVGPSMMIATEKGTGLVQGRAPRRVVSVNGMSGIEMAAFSIMTSSPETLEMMLEMLGNESHVLFWIEYPMTRRHHPEMYRPRPLPLQRHHLAQYRVGLRRWATSAP
jgi:hypothetical protein